MVPVAPLLYPDFYVNTEQVTQHFNPSSSQRVSLPHNIGLGRLPALPTEQGLYFDSEWAIFGAFEDTDRYHPEFKVYDILLKKGVSWDLKCPAMRDYESLLGHLIAQYGQHTGGDPDRPGMNAGQVQSEKPIKQVLKHIPGPALAQFEDRGRTLLDIAMYHQQWDLAEFLWGKGVRWSEQARSQGRPFEALVVATIGLQGILLSRPLDCFSESASPPSEDERVAWLETWLDRCREQQVSVAPEKPELDLRARLAHIRNWDLGKQLRDTPVSFWTTRFTECGPGASGLGLRPVDHSSHVQTLVKTWVEFWARAGADPMTTPVASGRGTDPGFAQFWEQTRNGPEWTQFVQATLRRMRLAQEVVPCENRPSSPRAF